MDSAAKAFLREHGAEQIDHPGGTLYTHLCRVEQLLAAAGAAEHVRLAGLTHAVYGTDGFDKVLVPWTERDIVRAVIGPDAEELVYLYGASDRDRTWPGLATTGTVHDRFTGAATRIPGDRLGQLADVSIVNELDVIEHNPALLDRHGAYFRDLFARWAPITSPGVAAQVRRVL